MRRFFATLISIVLFAGLITIPTVSATPNQGRTYLFYEDFNDMTSGVLPAGMSFINGTSPAVQKTTVSEGNYAMKFTTEGMADATVSGLAMQLCDVVVGKGSVGADDHSDRITIEFDLKNEHGAFGLSWLTSEEVSDGYTAKVWRKKPILLGNSDRQMWPLPSGTNGAWTGENNPTHANGDAGMISGDTAFTSFGKWIHITMVLDGETVEISNRRDRFMYSEVSWYEKDTPETVHRAYYSGNDGRGMYIDNASGTYVSSELGGYKQTDIASIVLPVFHYQPSTRGIPSMEIDNITIYLTNGDSSATYAGVDSVTFSNSSSSDLAIAPAITTGITVNFGTAMKSNIGSHINLTCNGIDIPITGMLTNNGLTYTVTPAEPLSPLTEYVLTIDDEAVAANGSLLANEYTKVFITDRGLNVTAFNITNGSSAINAIPSAGTNLNLSITTNNDCTIGGWLFLAEYQGGDLKGFNSKYVDMSSGVSTNTLTSNISMIQGVDTIKAFLWDPEFTSLHEPVVIGN